MVYILISKNRAKAEMGIDMKEHHTDRSNLLTP